MRERGRMSEIIQAHPTVRAATDADTGNVQRTEKPLPDMRACLFRPRRIVLAGTEATCS
jgi:hypothetical protein